MIAELNTLLVAALQLYNGSNEKEDEPDNGSYATSILLANLGESDKIAKLQVHGEYSRMGEPTWTKQEPGKRHDCWEKLHHTVGIAAFSVIEIQRRSFIAILTQPRRIRQQYQPC